MKVDKLRLFAAIRGEADQGQSIRTLAARYRVHRRTIRQALTSATPPPRKAPTRGSPVLNHVRDLIDAPVNQGLTARQIWERLLDDHDAAISYSTVATYLAQRRKDPPT